MCGTPFDFSVSAVQPFSFVCAIVQNADIEVDKHSLVGIIDIYLICGGCRNFHGKMKKEGGIP